MQSSKQRPRAFFPPWTNAIRPLATAAILGGLLYTVVLIAYATSPRTTNVGYAPTQPVPYSHALHVGRSAWTAATATRASRREPMPTCRPPRPA